MELYRINKEPDVEIAFKKQLECLSESSEVKEYFKDKKKPLFDRALEGTYPPGSTFKIFVCASIVVQNAGKSAHASPLRLLVGIPQASGENPGWHPSADMIILKTNANPS